MPEPHKISIWRLENTEKKVLQFFGDITLGSSNPALIVLFGEKCLNLKRQEWEKLEFSIRVSNVAFLFFKSETDCLDWIKITIKLGDEKKYLDFTRFKYVLCQPPFADSFADLIGNYIKFMAITLFFPSV